MKKLLSILLMLMCISLGASATVKCKAVTQKGTKCTRVAKKDGYCVQHYKLNPNGTINAGSQCKAMTHSGTRCLRKAIKGGYCAQHYNIEQKKAQDPNFEKKVENCYDKDGKLIKAANDTERCQSSTKKGKRCKLKAIEGYKSCPVHI